MLIRGRTEVAWAVRAGLTADLIDELNNLAQQEPATTEWQRPPIHEDRYRAVVRGNVGWGPAFEFLASADIDPPTDVIEIDDEALLQEHFTGWVAGEFAAGASPVMAICADGHPVSVCSCARRSPAAAEAGLDTTRTYRGRGYARRVAAAWATAVRVSGRTPLYSTDWGNIASLAVARKLKLRIYATNWSVNS